MNYCQRCNHNQPREQTYTTIRGTTIRGTIVVCSNCLSELATIGHAHERSAPIRQAAETLCIMMDRLRDDYKSGKPHDERDEAAKRTMTAIRQQLQTIEDEHPGRLAEALEHITVATI